MVAHLVSALDDAAAQRPNENKYTVAQSSQGAPAWQSAGSAAHAVGRCKPCAFFHTKGCESGPECRFCHVCQPDERKRRRKEKLEQRQTAHQARQLRREAAFAGVATPGLQVPSARLAVYAQG
mmetsp:Transcript_117564/g.374593  ORF Transcript_117564/g.374593 Transcript_117564/m.374593 type:complete len:123 (-) Transcript_117564:91-459(-)